MRKFYFRAIIDWGKWSYSKKLMTAEEVLAILKRAAEPENFKKISVSALELWIIGEEKPYIILW